MQKKAHLIITVIAMFFIIIAFLLSSFQIAIYGDSEYKFYEKEYVKYNVTESLHMTIEDVMDVTEHMMDYLIDREARLSVETDVDGKKQDFFNEQDRLHMADVKNLFLGGLKLRTILIVVALIFMGTLVLLKADIKKLLLKAYGISMGVFAALLAFLGIAFTIDFTKCFTIFHKIFFTNDLWMFDPATDYMIRMLPEGFFSDMVMRIVLIFIAFLILGMLSIFCIQKLVTNIGNGGHESAKKQK